MKSPVMRKSPTVAALLLAAALPALISAPTPAIAQEGCPAEAAPLPAGYAGWDNARPLAASTDAAGLDAAGFAAGEAVDMGLSPDGEVAYLSLPRGAGEEASFGGMAAVELAEAGRYRVALGDYAWVDLISDGVAAESVAHGHGPKCSPIRKIVEFELEAGRHTLEISGNAAPDIRVMVIRAED